MRAMPTRLMLFVCALLLLGGCATTDNSQKKGRYASAPAPAPQTKHKQAEQKEAVYFVRAGDTLSAIGRRFGVTSSQIQYRNGIADPRNLKIGARLLIPNKNQRVREVFASKARFIWPLKNLDVSSEFGTRNNRHKGIDLRAPKGTAIFASADGVVLFAGRKSGYGKVIILKHANNMQTLYAHNEKNLVSEGLRIRQGEKIATVGRTGNASGNHVHFEIVRGRKRLNPRDYVSM